MRRTLLLILLAAVAAWLAMSSSGQGGRTVCTQSLPDATWWGSDTVTFRIASHPSSSLSLTLAVRPQSVKSIAVHVTAESAAGRSDDVVKLTPSHGLGILTDTQPLPSASRLARSRGAAGDSLTVRITPQMQSLYAKGVLRIGLESVAGR